MIYCSAAKTDRKCRGESVLSIPPFEADLTLNGDSSTQHNQLRKTNKHYLRVLISREHSITFPVDVMKEALVFMLAKAINVFTWQSC